MISSDKDVIQQAYEDELKIMFEVMVNGAVTDGLNSAAQRFATGLTILRSARDRAQQIVQAAATPAAPQLAAAS